MQQQQQKARDLLSAPLLDHAGLDLDTASQITYVLHQQFEYRYSGTVTGLKHRLVVVPPRRHGSAVRRLHAVSASAADTRSTSRRDAGGNTVVRLRLDVVPETVQFTLDAVIVRSGPEHDPVLPASALGDPRLLTPTRLTRADDAVRDLAATHAVPGDALGTGEAFCAAVNAAITYEYGITHIGTTAAEALAVGRGVCQDSAHLMLAMCRARGVPARYVSGHLLGEGGTHAWVEVIVPDSAGARAVAFDPCNGCRTGPRHLTVATGRDYRDVAPTSGTYEGTGTGVLRTSKRLGVALVA